MEIYKFKTNINCNACKSAVQPFLKRDSRITHWDIDLADPDKILMIEGENISGNEIVELIYAAGYKIEPL